MKYTVTKFYTVTRTYVVEAPNREIAVAYCDGQEPFAVDETWEDVDIAEGAP